MVLRGNSRTMKATRSISPQEQGRPSLADGGGNRPVGGIGGARTVVRGWRVKGRDVLGPVDTAESPEREASRVARKFVRMRIYRLAGGLNGETEARSRVVFAPSVSLYLRFTTSFSRVPLTPLLLPRSSILFVSLRVSCFPPIVVLLVAGLIRFHSLRW